MGCGAGLRRGGGSSRCDSRAGFQGGEQGGRNLGASASAADALARLSGATVTVSRLLIPSGLSMAAERNRDRSGAALLVGARLGVIAGDISDVEVVRRCDGL